MLVLNNSKCRGDTLIEVLFAVAAFSLVAVSGLSIMNQGSAIAQRSLEITLVRQEIDSQADTLRFLNAAYAGAYQPGTTYNDYFNTPEKMQTPASQWALMLKNITTNSAPISNFGLDATGKCPTVHPNGSFILDTHNAKFITPAPALLKPAQVFSRVLYNYNNATKIFTLSSVEGIWIEAVRKFENTNNQNTADYVDFHIRACWDSPGQSVPLTIGTIVRLYEPRG